MDVLRHVGGIDGLDKLLLGGREDERWRREKSSGEAVAAHDKKRAVAEATIKLKEGEEEGKEEK